MFKIPVLRQTTYYLRTVAFPLVLISSLSFASNFIETFEEQVGFNSSLLLTTVAYLFITKDVTPDTSQVTMLDMITYGALVLSWALIMIRCIAISEDTSEIFKESEGMVTRWLCLVVTGLQCILFIYLYLRHRYYRRSSEELGDFK